MDLNALSTILDGDRALVFGLLLARCSGLLAAAPLFGDSVVPRPVRALLAGLLALLLLPLAAPLTEAPKGLAGLVALALVEVAIGAAMGFLARLALLVFEMAGEIVAIQMGMSIASVVDPLQPHRTTVLGRWYWLVGSALFLTLDGHHHLLRALATSLDIVPAGRGTIGGDMVAALTRYSADTFGRALAMAAPAVGILLATSLALGLLARTVPQMNVFLVGFPVQIAAGILAVVAAVPFLLEIARREVIDLASRLGTLMSAV